MQSRCGSENVCTKKSVSLGFLKDRRGSAAVEFAFVILPFSLLMFAIMELGYKSLVQSELDSTAHSVYEDISLNTPTSKTWQEYRESFCATNSNFFVSCSKIIFSTAVIASRAYTMNNVVIGGAWNVGCSSDVVLIELLYPLTNIVHNIVIGDIVTYKGAKYYRSRAILKREPLVGGAAC